MFGMRGYTPKFIAEAKEAKFKCNYIIQLLIFIAMFFVTQVVGSMAATVFMMPKIISGLGELNAASPEYMQEVMKITVQIVTDPLFVLASLFVTIITTAIVIIYCKFIEKRTLGSMGFYKKKAFINYLIGMAVGFVLYTAALAICYFTGSVEYNGMVMRGGIGMIMVFALGFFFQGMSEEVVLRGYFMPSLSNRAPLFVAVLTNSVMFGLMHFGNPGVTVYAIINIALFGVLMSVYMLKTGSIWGVCAIHSVWNFVQGNLYGGEVSGLNASAATVFSFTRTEGSTLINGGKFGLEGGLAVTIVLVIAIVIVSLIKPVKLEEK